MEGIREIGMLSNSRDVLTYASPLEDRLTGTCITSAPEGFERKTFRIRAAGIRSFLEGEFADQNHVAAGYHSVRVLRVTSQSPGIIDLDYDVCQHVLEQIGLERWIGRLVRNWTYGYHHSDRDADTQSTSFYLGTGHFTAMWTTTCRSSPCYVTKAVIIVQRDNQRDIAGRLIYDRIVKGLELFSGVSRSPLYLAFVLSVDILTVRESIITNIFSTIRNIESITGYGSWGQGLGDFLRNPEGIKSCTSQLGRALNQLADIYKHLNMVDLVFEDLQAHSLQLQSSDGNGPVMTSTKSMMEAIHILRQQSAQFRDQAKYLEVRVRSQSSVLFSHLTHQDAQVNIQAAHASVQLAEAARRDGSSMKTIAVLTMAFLPGTFFAAFFAIPSPGWTQPDKVALFWACTVPVTAATFLLWAGITQRKAMRGAIAELRRCAEGKRLGSVGSTGDGNLGSMTIGSGHPH